MTDSKPKATSLGLFGGTKKDFSKKIYTVPTKTVGRTASVQPPVQVKPVAPLRLGKNGLPKLDLKARKSLTPSRSSSRRNSSEPSVGPRTSKPSRTKRVSSPRSTPTWASDEEDESETRRKRARIDKKETSDSKRQITDKSSFAEGDPTSYEIIHAADIANNQIQQHGRFQFEEYFTTLTADEDDCPTIELQYPGRGMVERYSLVRPVDRSDFKPLSEIQDNMQIVSEFYLDEETAEVVAAGEFGGGLVGQLQKAAKEAGKAGSQSKFVNVIKEYNAILDRKRSDGTIQRSLDNMNQIPLKLVQHIVKGQIYSRTVSPKVDTVRKYEGFSDNVYGELLPKFLSRIFQETQLKSDQIFVDLGSGVGNCVLQAALEVGCESWGCEVMRNPATLAEASAREFPSRCKMWGIKPGTVHLYQDDFTSNIAIRETLKKADVVLVNNQAFTPELNDKLKYIFLDLKEGCQIVSLKYFRDPLHKVKETNINDPVNVLRVSEKERFSGMVSWSDDPGKWYLQVKDMAELRAVQRRVERTQQV